MAKIAFIGLGNMGLGMATSLAKAGLEVIGFDLSKEAQSAALAAGCKIEKSVPDAVNGADAVVLMLPNGKIVRQVCNDVFSASDKGALVIDCSTIDVATERAIISAAEEHGIDMIDAGDAGNGQVAKICNNMLLGIHMIGTCEAFNLAEKLGLDAQTFYDISSTASGQNWSMTSYCPAPGPVETAPSNNNYQPGFAAGMMLKDLRLAQEAASSAKAPTPLGAQSEAIYSLMEAAGKDELDFSGVMKLINGSLLS